LEHELAAAVTHVRTLKRLLAEQEGTDGWLSQYHSRGNWQNVSAETLGPSSGQLLV
jgi:hypothetical protein